VVHSSEAPKPAPAANGPLVEITPQSGDAFSGYLLSMKDGSMDVQLASGETRSEKTSDVKSVRFVPPPEPAATPKDAAPADAPKDSPVELKKREERREEMKQLRVLILKLRDGTMTPAEEDEMNKLGEHMALIRPLGGTAGTMALMRSFEAARLDVKKEAGHLDEYIVRQRDALKEANSENAIRIVIMHLACAYHQKDMPPAEVEEQIMKKDMQLISIKLKKNLEAERARRLVELMYLINGEKIPKGIDKDKDK
jgi:hypothetical protein